MRISLKTGLFSIWCVISASYMYQIYHFLVGLLESGSIPLASFLTVVLALFGLGLAAYALATKKFLRLLLTGALFALLVLYSFQLDIIAERVHLMQFGILGFLVSLDNLKGRLALKPVAFSLGWCLVIILLDETFQYFLPSRVGDIRDILTGFIGSLFGALMYASMHLPFRPAKKGEA